MSETSNKTEKTQSAASRMASNSRAWGMVAPPIWYWPLRTSWYQMNFALSYHGYASVLHLAFEKLNLCMEVA